jgi:hypothetical protein
VVTQDTSSNSTVIIKKYLFQNTENEFFVCKKGNSNNPVHKVNLSSDNEKLLDECYVNTVVLNKKKQFCEKFLEDPESKTITVSLLIDSCASAHISGNQEFFLKKKIQILDEKIQITTLAVNTPLLATGYGDLDLWF